MPPISKAFHFQQISYDDSDWISIYEIDSIGNRTLVTYLIGPDSGPKSESSFSNWDKKIISISANNMNIEFKSDDFFEYKGFSANIYFTPVTNKECEAWLDMDKKSFKSPNYPQLHHKDTKCNWLITVDFNNHITLNFIELDVILSYI